jgi:hypothetical protein
MGGHQHCGLQRGAGQAEDELRAGVAGPALDFGRGEIPVQIDGDRVGQALARGEQTGAELGRCGREQGRPEHCAA